MSMSKTEKTVKDIRRNTRRKFSTEEKIRIVLDGLRGESSIAGNTQKFDYVIHLWAGGRSVCYTS
jgi:transposase-like protein